MNYKESRMEHIRMYWAGEIRQWDMLYMTEILDYFEEEEHHEPPAK